MKIAFFNHTLRLGSGIDTVITELATRLTKSDDVTVLCFNTDYNKEEYAFQIKVIKSVWSSTPNRIACFAPFLMDKVGDLIAQLEQYDVVNTHIFPANFLGRNLKKPLNVVTEWSVGDPKLWPSSLKQRLYTRWLVYEGNKIASRNADILLASSHFIKRWIIKNYSLEPTVMHLDGINFGLLDKDKDNADHDLLFERYPEVENKKIILFVGRITDHKNVHLLIEAFDILMRRSQSDVILFLVGDYHNYKAYYQKLLRLIENKNLQDKVIFTGVVPWKDLSVYYSACSIFATCTVWEGFLRPEAFAFEKPIVCFDIGPNSETVVDGETGFLVKEINAERFADRMDALLNDDSLAREMGRKGYLWAKQNLDFDTIADNFRTMCENTDKK
jgi:glycosyltransferase involved in cell wall biosynthesis